MYNKALKQLISLHLPTINVTVLTCQGRLQNLISPPGFSNRTYLTVQVLDLLADHRHPLSAKITANLTACYRAKHLIGNGQRGCFPTQPTFLCQVKKKRVLIYAPGSHQPAPEKVFTKRTQCWLNVSDVRL